MTKNDGAFWTLQQFATLPGGPWFALQKQNDGGVAWQFTGYRHEVDALCRKLRIRPEELPPTTEEEFLSRGTGEPPPDTPSGRFR